MKTKPCVGCGQQVPEQGEYPYPDCAPDCPLASEWRRESDKIQTVVKAARRWYEVQRGTMAALSPSGLAVAAALKALDER